MSYSFYTKMPSHHVTSIDDTNPWWVAIKASIAKMGQQIEPEIFPAATDSRYFRLNNVPCFGSLWLYEVRSERIVVSSLDDS